MTGFRYIQDDNYVTIPSILRVQYGLKGNDLLVAAIIYGFSQDKDSEFYGSIRYICEWTGLSSVTVISILKKLVGMGIVRKTDYDIQNVKTCSYKFLISSKETLGVVKKFNRGSKETLEGGIKKLNRGSKETLPNNINNNIKIKDKDNKSTVVCSRFIEIKDYDGFSFDFVEPAFADIFRIWLEYKKETFKDSYKTQKALQACYSQLKKLSGGIAEKAVEIVNQSMANNWKGLFELKNINTYGNNRTTPEQREEAVAEQGQRIITRLMQENIGGVADLRQD